MKAIPKFWAVALMNNELFAMHAQHHGDQAALAYLEDVWLVRDPLETRVFTIEFVSIVYRVKLKPVLSNIGSTSKRTRTFRTRC